MKTRGLLAIFVVFSLLAQTPPAAEPPATILRSTSRLIQVNVVAQDRKGNPVTDLTREDFVLTDAGKSQNIAFFQLEREEVAAAPKTVDANVMTLSNHVEQTAGAITVILFDSLNTRFMDQARARTELIKYLKQASPDDRIALYSLGRELKILHEFTGSTATLIRALDGSSRQGLDSVAADADSDDPNTGEQSLDNLMSWAKGHFADFVNLNRAEVTLTALEAIAQHVSRIPGRKNLVWISGGFPFSINQNGMSTDSQRDSRNFDDETMKMARFLNDANMAIYSIDVRGVFSPDMPMPSGGPRNAAAPRGLRTDHTRETFDVVAERTGGRSFHNTNDLGGAIQRAVDDARVTYAIGYYPADAMWDGKFHQIKLQCKRPGVQMHYRPGYFATNEQPKPAIASIEDTVRSNAFSTGIGLTVSLTRQNQQLEALVTVQTSDVSFVLKEGKWSAQIEYLAVSGDAGTGVFRGKPTVLNLGLQESAYETALKNGIRLKSTFDLTPDTNQFRIAVRDTNSGAAGSLIFHRNLEFKAK